MTFPLVRIEFRSFAITSLIVGLSFASPLFAQKNPRSSNARPSASTENKDSSTNPRRNADARKKTTAKKSAASAITAKREKAALAFAKKHHTELVSLLVRLRDEDKSQYGRAIRDLATTNERLAKIKERLPDRYKRDLANWKLDSRIHMILARLRMADPSEVDSLRDQLRRMVERRTDSRLAQLHEEQAKLDARAKKLAVSIKDIETDRTAFIDREIKRLDRTLRTRPSSKPTKQSLARRKSNAKSKTEKTRTNDSASGAVKTTPVKTKKKTKQDNQ